MFDVVIKKISTNETVKKITKDPVTMTEAEAIELSANVNINQEEYKVSIIQA
ncbi:hypothetical protein D3C74_387300 [compost metagenome]